MTAQVVVHATTIAFDGRGVLILGGAGRGKSSLALLLLAIGAVLVADDQTVLTRQGAQIVATCPPALEGLIEARAVGLLHAPHLPRADLCLAVDLDQTETARLPDHRSTVLLGRPLSVVYGNTSAHFPSSVKHYVMFGRKA